MTNKKSIEKPKNWGVRGDPAFGDSNPQNPEPINLKEQFKGPKQHQCATHKPLANLKDNNFNRMPFLSKTRRGKS